MERKYLETAKEKIYMFWISRAVKCLSFHAISQFEVISFTSHEEMWEAVHCYVEAGYLVE